MLLQGGIEGCARNDSPSPRYVLMTLDRLSPQEMQAVHDGLIVTIPLINIHMTGSQVRSDETKAGVVVFESDANSAFVTRHAAQTGLFSGKCRRMYYERPRTNLAFSCFDVANHGS